MDRKTMNQLRRTVLLLMAVVAACGALAIGWGVGAWVAPSVSVARTEGDGMPPEPYHFAPIETTPPIAAPPSEETEMPKPKTSETESAETVAVAAVAAPATRTAATTERPAPIATASAEPRSAPPDVPTPPVDPGKPDNPGPPQGRKWQESDEADFEARCAAIAASQPEGTKVKLDRSRMPKVGDDLPDGATPAMWCTVEPPPVTPRT
jgi:hypothetical protein